MHFSTFCKVFLQFKVLSDNRRYFLSENIIHTLIVQLFDITYLMVREYL